MPSEVRLASAAACLGLQVLSSELKQEAFVLPLLKLLLLLKCREPSSGPRTLPAAPHGSGSLEPAMCSIHAGCMGAGSLAGSCRYSSVRQSVPVRMLQVVAWCHANLC